MAQLSESATHNHTGSFSEDPEHSQSVAAQAGHRIEQAADNIATTVKEYPMTTLALAAGLAFAMGALWKIGRPRPSRWDALQARMPDIPSARQLKSYWR